MAQELFESRGVEILILRDHATFDVLLLHWDAVVRHFLVKLFKNLSDRGYVHFYKFTNVFVRIADVCKLVYDHVTKELLITVIPVLTILDYMSSLSNYSLSDTVVKLGALIDLSIKLPKKFQLNYS